MMHGYATREELIRDHWKRYGGAWNAERYPRLKLPIRHKDYPFAPLEREMKDSPIDWDIDFAFERGALDGRPAYRITCEGVVVEEGLL